MFSKKFRHWGEQWQMWKDLWRTRREAGFLRKNLPEAAEDRVVLVPAVHGFWIYRIKFYSVLALGLRLRGWRVRVVLHSRDRKWSQRYFRAFGLDDFVYWSDFELTAEQRTAAREDARNFLDGAMDFRSVKNWVYKGCWIGPQILATVSRGLFEGSPDPTDPAVRARIETMLPSVLRMVFTAEKLLDSVHPQLMLVNEPNYARNGALTDVAVNRGINLISISQIAADDALIFRRLNKQTRREHPRSIDRERFHELQKEPWTEIEERELAEYFDALYSGKWFLQRRTHPSTQEATREEIFRQLQLDPARKVAIVFSHVLWDANLFYGEDLFQDYGEWFVETVKAATRNPAVNWLIKLHPANIWKRQTDEVTAELNEVTLIREHIGELPPHVHLLHPDFPISTRSLFGIADYVVTVRGTVSTEAPCFGVPTFTAGTGRAHGFGFTIDSETRQEYLERLATIQNYAPLSAEKTLRAKHHAHIVFCRRPWLMRSVQASFFEPKTGRHPLDHNLHLTARSVAELRRHGDLERWAEWAVQPAVIDYLEK